ncbi:hypothetical protein OHB41_10300 [Streptomyces sp. NBC_01571]|uniref:hypothetical protein n=1 Tax=Streptomyces sp. NBC_01571 TaxID=2975883 RepID=UPI0022580401|nr:hypothetical protein [Streptomyces sp. NBC_01571]MCX4573565.1 hypothetical protein [Streptomyces sp. NBC_01571]
MFTTYQAEAPATLRMRCVRCALEGLDTTAEVLVSATSGHGMAACAPHREVTLGTFTAADVVELRAVFTLTGMACTGEPLMVVAEPDRPRPPVVPVVAPKLLELQETARDAARRAGPLDGHKLIAALAACGIPAWLAEDSGISYILAALDRTADEGKAHTGPKVYSGENADLDPADHTDPWTCARYDGTGEFADILFTARTGEGLYAECAHAALCLAAWPDAHGHRYPRARPATSCPSLYSIDFTNTVRRS